MMLRSSRLLLLSSFLIACGSSQPPAAQPAMDPNVTPAPLGPTTPPPIADAGVADAGPAATAIDPNAVPQFATEIEAFNSDLYAKLKTSKGNIFYSPTSIEIALAMTAAGARGTTASQMQQVLHLPSDTASANAGAAQLLSSWTTPSATGPTLTIANRLWGQKGYAFLPDYLQTTRDSFGAELAQVDYKTAAEQARSTINGWVADQTNQKILNLIPAGSVTALTRLVLTNAVYFKGAWQVAFDKALTKNAPFKTSASSVSVPTMHHSFTRASYTDNAHAQIVALPYKGDATHSLSIIIALPKPGTKVGDLESDLSATAVTDWTKKMTPVPVNVSLPRFKTSAQMDLGTTLKQLGMPLAFTDSADFTGMATKGSDPLEITSVVHKAYVDVNEEGTEAAAATGVVMGTRAAMIGAPPIEFKVDHAFLFFIRDDRSGAILFAGRIEDPSK
jgi:serpin B